MGSAESKTLTPYSSSGPNSRGAEVTSTVPLAKEELIFWKLENISTLLQLAKDSTDFCSLASQRFTNHDFEISPQTEVGWTKWRLRFCILPQSDPSLTPTHFSLYLEKVDRVPGTETNKMWFNGDVLVKMELLPDSKLPWSWNCCSPPVDPFKLREKYPLVANISHEAGETPEVGWEDFLRIDSLYGTKCGSNQPHHLASKAVLDDSTLIISLKVTFQYLHVTTTSRQLATYDVLNLECDKEFKKAMDSLFEQHVKVCNTPPSTADLSKMGSVVLSISGKFITVQKCFLTTRSPIFKTMFKDGTRENRLGIAEINDIKYQAMLSVLEYIYTGKLPISGKSQDSWKKYPGDVVLAAEKYDLPLLKRFCEQNLAEVCTKSNAKELYGLAKQYKFENAKQQIWKFIQTMDPDSIM